MVENREHVACGNMGEKEVNELVDLPEAISGKNVCQQYLFYWPKQVRRLGFKDGRMDSFARKK